MKAPAPAVPARGLLRNAKLKLLFGLVAFSVALPLCLAICAVHGLSLLTGLSAALVGSVAVTLVSGPVLKNREHLRADYAPPADSLGPPAAPPPAASDTAAAAHVRAEAVKLTNS